MQTLGVLGDVTMEKSAETHEIRAYNYLDWLRLVPSFLSLDISVHGTGWVSWRDGILTCGRLSLKATDETERVVEFRKALLGIINGFAYDYYFIEDVIGSCNFKTARSLYSLNRVLDMLIYEKTIKAPIALFRESNVTWKKNLRGIAGSDFVIKGVDFTNGSDKECTKACLKALGVDIDVLKCGKYTDKQVEDICDALGMALGTIAAKVDKTPMIKSRVLTTDIRHGYKIQQFTDYASASKSALHCAKSKGRNIIEHDLTVVGSASDLIRFMAKIIPDDPDAVYLVHTPVSKCCNLLLVKRLETLLPSYYLTIRR